MGLFQETRILFTPRASVGETMSCILAIWACPHGVPTTCPLLGKVGGQRWTGTGEALLPRSKVSSTQHCFQLKKKAGKSRLQLLVFLNPKRRVGQDQKYLGDQSGRSAGIPERSEMKGGVFIAR